jgi:hypothetical protein
MRTPIRVSLRCAIKTYLYHAYFPRLGSFRLGNSPSNKNDAALLRHFLQYSAVQVGQ